MQSQQDHPLDVVEQAFVAGYQAALSEIQDAADRHFGVGLVAVSERLSEPERFAAGAYADWKATRS